MFFLKPAVEKYPVTEEAAKKSKSPKSKKSGPDKATKAARTYEHKVRALNKHLNSIVKRNVRRRKKGKEEIAPDNQAVAALSKLEKKGSTTPRRTPNSEKWTRETKMFAEQHRKVGYNGNGVLKFGMQGVGVYEGAKAYHKKDCQKLVTKFLTALEARKSEETKKQKDERMLKEAAARRRTEEERKKLNKNKKSAKLPSKGKPKAKAEKPKQ